MSDYIKREDALKALSEIAVFTDVAEDVVNDIPSADVVEVVRCKDCKWYYISKVNGQGWCDIHENSDVDGEGFCNYGKRKDGEDE